MTISPRGWCVVGACAAFLGAMILLSSPLLTAADAPAGKPGQLTHAQLGQMLGAMGLKVKEEQLRYDFDFLATYNGEEWKLTMSAVLSENGESIWVMAWLDELPKASADVPKIALLRLLANNDRLGKGQFFAYVSGNRRFVLQRVIDNKDLTTADFRTVLQELGGSVAETYPYWAVANWKSEAAAEGTATPGTGDAQPAPATQSQRIPAQSALRDSKFQGTARQ